MKPDDFENQLQRQPLRPMPSAWRAHILREANDCVIRGRFTLRGHDSNSLPVLRGGPATSWWREWLWPCPQAWAGLAALWLLILGMNLATAARSNSIAKQTPTPFPEGGTTLAAQRRELARLLDNINEPMPQPKGGPTSPRSENFSPPKV